MAGLLVWGGVSAVAHVTVNDQNLDAGLLLAVHCNTTQIAVG